MFVFFLRKVYYFLFLRYEVNTVYSFLIEDLSDIRVERRDIRFKDLKERKKVLLLVYPKCCIRS